jgi:hypothetical protein
MLLDEPEDVDVPLAFVAVSVNVYACPEAYVPVTANGLVVPVVVSDTDGLEVVVYEVMLFPPVAPAVNAKETVVLFVTVAVPTVGACGTVVAVILFDAEEALDVPAAFVAVTVNV